MELTVARVVREYDIWLGEVFDRPGTVAILKKAPAEVLAFVREHKDEIRKYLREQIEESNRKIKSIQAWKTCWECGRRFRPQDVLPGGSWKDGYCGC